MLISDLSIETNMNFVLVKEEPVEKENCTPRRVTKDWQGDRGGLQAVRSGQPPTYNLLIMNDSELSSVDMKCPKDSNWKIELSFMIRATLR